MINFHWMYRGPQLSTTDIENLSSKLDAAGYYSVLLPFHTQWSDYLLKTARAINPAQRLKYFIAIRPYALSPQYLAMMCEAFNEIAENRLMLNLVVGRVSNDEDLEGFAPGVDPSQLQTNQARKDYRDSFLLNFQRIKVLKTRPEIVIAGSSEQSIEAAATYGDVLAASYGDFMLDPDRHFERTGRLLISVGLIICDTSEEAARTYDELQNTPVFFKTNYMYGSLPEIREKLLDLHNSGVSDIMVYNLPARPEDAAKIHELVSSLGDVD